MTTTDDLLDLDFHAEQTRPVTRPERFTNRWTLAAAGLANVWRFGDLDLRAPSGRLLFRGANGTGKTTALEALAPYLLDLNARKLAAGKARPTSLSSLMKEGSGGKRRIGYAWLTFAAAGDPAPGADTGDASGAPGPQQTWGVRLQFSPNASPQIKQVPFTVPGRPLVDLDLYGPGRAALSAEEFTAAVNAAGGHVFDSSDEYVAHLARTVWSTSSTQLEHMAGLIRNIRNPSTLATVSPNDAAATLRENLPSVDRTVLEATAEALAASDATRDAFSRDREAAATLGHFAAAWTGHVADVVTKARANAADAHRDLLDAERRHRAAVKDERTKDAVRADEQKNHAAATTRAQKAAARLSALEQSEAYRAALELGTLQDGLAAAKTHARTTLDQLEGVARHVRERSERLERDLAEVAEQVHEAAASLDPDDQAQAGEASTSVAWTTTARSTLAVGTRTIQPGPALDITTTVDDLTALAGTWEQQADASSARADRAQLAASKYRDEVEKARTTAERAERAAALQRERSEDARESLTQATSAAAQARDAFFDAVTTWVGEYPELAGEALTTATSVTDDPTSEAPEPAQLLSEAADWVTETTAIVLDTAARATAEANRLKERAEALATEAADLRGEARRLRDGELLPLPRPTWAAGDDTPAVGEALSWMKSFADDPNRAGLEEALAASGLLGAVIDTAGVRGTSPSGHPWVLTGTTHGTGAPSRSLLEVIDVDPAAPGVEAITDALRAVELVDTLGQANSTVGLVVCLDGTFRTGTFTGDPLRADDGTRRDPAAPTYVGAHQRHAAALARAEQLETQAAALDLEATQVRAAAEQEAAAATQVRRDAATFPATGPLQTAEATRAAAATSAAAEEQRTLKAEADAKAAAATAHAAAGDWTRWCTALDLPADVEALRGVREKAQARARDYTQAARAVTRNAAPRLRRLGSDAATDARNALRLESLHAEAICAHGRATDQAETVRAHQETLGKDAQEILEMREQAREDAEKAAEKVSAAEARARDARDEHIRAQSSVTSTRDRLQERQPGTRAAITALRELLETPGVQNALRGPDPEPGEETPAEAPTSDEESDAATRLLAQAAALLSGHRAVGRKLLNERYDQARAQLAGTWTLDHAEAVGELSTYVLIYRDETFTPAAAARHAQKIAEQAEAALREAEEAALRDFIIGRLPSAIGVAWQRILDWKDQVNDKMKDATASSGVGVQVAIKPAAEITAAMKTVYTLCCKTSDADRTAEQAREVGTALRSLIDAAEGQTTVEKLTAAVDVREWADVRYWVTRPGSEPTPWGSRTGLSGGERRLVVIAPMLAAIAAGWDSLADGGLRLVLLDEVPAEVDEAGREALARYIAELDLDLLCTSYLWDGAPGAWDGIDAWDFEASDDGLVVAFGAHIRGLVSLPGEEDTVPEHPLAGSLQ